jgi:transcription-repair coupling factor (superfamily II helicase)
VDIVIGTHRLVQQDVHFKDLGLVIIDEEQRFGVTHKERLKQLRQLVDVLTMTATPIPRTLYMSLTGARDMSTIQTPPRERLPIETHVVEYTDDLVRDVILRELNREGQVFFLHNRVMTIHQVEQRLKKLVPEARIGVGHGQMSERALAKVMRLFVQGDIDVLLCTTIIESGVDIPNVNTILIDRADRFGMADLYQLRGRVGRYRHKAYAYLLLPRHGQLFHTARQRIGAIKRYSSLGAGFKLALRDLEIRGAGNLLGAQQSGHIAAIGFDLYCQLLRRTIAHIKGETTAPLVQVEMRLDFIDRSPRHAESCDTAAIPYGYIEDENHRVQIYRDMAAAGSIRTIDRLRDSLRDRFGPVPAPMLRLLAIARIRICAAEKGISAIETREDKLILTRAGDYIKFHRRFPRLQSSDPDGKLQEILAFLTGLQQTR